MQSFMVVYFFQNKALMDGWTLKRVIGVTQYISKCIYKLKFKGKHVIYVYMWLTSICKLSFNKKANL